MNMARGKYCRDNEDSWEEGVVRFVRTREMDAEVVWRAQSVSSGSSGLPPFSTAEWSCNGCHASSRLGIERVQSRWRREENTEAVLGYPTAPGNDKSWVIVGLVYSEVLAGFRDRIEVLKSWDSGFDSTEESVKGSVSIAKM